MDQFRERVPLWETKSRASLSERVYIYIFSSVSLGEMAILGTLWTWQLFKRLHSKEQKICGILSLPLFLGKACLGRTTLERLWTKMRLKAKKGEGSAVSHTREPSRGIVSVFLKRGGHKLSINCEACLRKPRYQDTKSRQGGRFSQKRNHLTFFVRLRLRDSSCQSVDLWLERWRVCRVLD